MTKVNEKKIYNQCLHKVVEHLNQNTELQDTTEEIYSKKNIRLNNKKTKKVKLSKIEKNPEILENKTEDKKEITKRKETNKEVSPNLNIEKLTRKQRRKQKIENKGKGISAKEYMRMYKEGTDRRIEKDKNTKNALQIPSKRKDDFSLREGMTKRKNVARSKSSRVRRK